MKTTGIAIAWLLLVTTLLCTPGSQFPKINWPGTIWLDKWIHLFLFLVLVILWCRVYLEKTANASRRKTFMILTVISILYGAAMEIIQHYFIPFRSFDYADIMADAAGALAGYWISVKRFKRTDYG